MKVPKSLKTWFLIHFIMDFAVAIPLFIFPTSLLTLLGWQHIDPLTARIVAAALFGIGGESLLVQNARIEVFKRMVMMKIIWSTFAVLGIIISIFENTAGYSFFAWLFFALFLGFNILWVYYHFKLKSMSD